MQLNLRLDSSIRTDLTRENRFASELRAHSQSAFFPPGVGLPTIKPQSVNDAGFSTSISAPRVPNSSAIPPPSEGSDATEALQGTGATLKSTMAKLAYIAAIKLEMASSQTNGAAGDRKSILSSIGVRV